LTASLFANTKLVEHDVFTPSINTLTSVCAIDGDGQSIIFHALMALGVLGGTGAYMAKHATQDKGIPAVCPCG
jgi:hypothetical protein